MDEAREREQDGPVPSDDEPLAAEPELPPEDEPLVMAMPRRELYELQGFTTAVAMPVIESVAEEHWFALPGVVAEDIDAKVVKLGVVLQRDDEEILIAEDGSLLHTSAVPPEVSLLGAGLRGLREFARQACGEMMETPVPRVELWGYLNLDGEPELRPFFYLVYRARVDSDQPAPPGMSWVGRKRARDLPADAASAAVLAGWPSPPRDG